ncbi:MAG: hypothetical protein WB952_26590 [Terriglobales bacterium]
MKRFGIVMMLVVFCSTFAYAQSQTSTNPQETLVPRLLRFSGTASDSNGKPLTEITGITFLIYKDQQAGAPLWMETQNVRPDAAGRYTITLGAAKAGGIPVELFTSGEARWVGVQVQGQTEQPRALLLSVPYALKAVDAQTLGGKPASAFVLAPTGSGWGAEASAPGSTKSQAAKPQFTSSGKLNYIPLFTDNSGDLGNSNIYQSPAGNVGIGFTNPQQKLVIAAPAGGGVVNASNLADQDMQITLSAPGASDKHAYFGTSTATNLTLGVGGVEKVRITNAGNVGIGSKNPKQRLVIAAPAGGGVLNASNLADQDLQVTLSAPGASDKYAYFGPSTATSLTLGVGGLDMMRLTNAGRVGIGTNAPAATLDVHGTSNFTGSVTASSFNGSGAGLTNITAANSAALGGFPAAFFATLGSNTFAGGQAVNNMNGNVGLSASGTVEGVYGSGMQYGVKGTAGFANGEGVYGSAAGAGVYGYSNGGGPGTSTGYGVYGTGTNVGVMGVGGEQIAVEAMNDSSDSSHPSLFAYNQYSYGWPFTAKNASGNGCSIDLHGNINCTGSKNAVVPIDGGRRKVALSAIESPKNWFEDFGSDQLLNGAAVVHLEPEFAQTVNTALAYHVFLTPNGDCQGLYVSQKTPGSFEVHELGKGTSNVKFDYRIVALRKNFENVRMADHTHDDDAINKMLEKMAPSLQPENKTILPGENRTDSSAYRN